MAEIEDVFDNFVVVDVVVVEPEFGSLVELAVVDVVVVDFVAPNTVVVDDLVVVISDDVVSSVDISMHSKLPYEFSQISPILASHSWVPITHSSMSIQAVSSSLTSSPAGQLPVCW